MTLDTEHFATTYLIAHGAAKLFIAWGLVREKLWAFPTALVVFGLLVGYQLFRLAHTHSQTLAVLIAIISYFSISGFLNKIKIVPQEELTRMIFRNTGSILGAAGIILILIIAVRALTLMVF